MKVFVVLHDNYGDQGSDFHGVFATRALANKYIKERVKSFKRFKYEEQYYDIVETVLHEQDDN